MGYGLTISAAMTKELAGAAVRSMSPVHRRGAVFYASLPDDSETCRELLIATLWEHLLATAGHPWSYGRPSGRAAGPIQVVYGPLGRPSTRLGEDRGPAISFSTAGGRVWAALASDESAIGIDLAGAEEFQGQYPVERVFHPEELQHAEKLAGGNMAAAAALLWSTKEAVVKALGCGFHLVDPRQITVHPSASDCGGQTFPVSLSGKARMRFPRASGPALWVHSLAQGDMWLSIALLQRKPAVHG
jgi:phosphopantetheinyl transferase (holo-ACP synthase)